MALNKDVLGVALRNRANTYNDVDIDVEDPAAIDTYRLNFWKGIAEEVINHFKTAGVITVTTTGTATAHTGNRHYSIMTDVLIDTDLDALIAVGDFAVGESTEQQQQLLLISNKGDFKENPAICVGIAGWLKDDNAPGMLAEVKQEFERDGMVVNKLELTSEKLNINARY